MNSLDLWLNNHFDVLFIDSEKGLPFKFVISHFNGIFQSIQKLAPQYSLLSLKLAQDSEVLLVPWVFPAIQFQANKEMQRLARVCNEYYCQTFVLEHTQRRFFENAFYCTRDFVFLAIEIIYISKSELFLMFDQFFCEASTSIFMQSICDIIQLFPWGDIYIYIFQEDTT